MSSSWKVEWHGKKPKLRNPVLVEGLPGIGNVGKVAIDFIIDELKAKKIATFFSYSLPHSVFVNENNLVELPSLELYYKELKDQKKDLLFVAGEIQPIDEVSCYTFAETVLDVFQEFKGSDIITLGGIALRQIPEHPKVFITGNDKKAVQQYKSGTKADDQIYGVVGPIMGASGVLVGMAEKRKIPAVTLLAETLGHPLYLGVAGAKEIVAVLNTKLNLKIDATALDKEIKRVEKEMKQRIKALSQMQNQQQGAEAIQQETSYIG